MPFPALTRHLTSGSLSTPAIGAHFLIAALKGDPMSFPAVIDMLDDETRFEASLLIAYSAPVREVFLRSLTTLLPPCPIAQATLPALTHLISRPPCPCSTPVPATSTPSAPLGGGASVPDVAGHPFLTSTH